ncbi:MAG TPA: hypothetical protein VF929_11065 [Gemmatimonadaceae bacterium]
MGCLLRLGCLFVLLCVGVVAWLTHEKWIVHVTGTPPAVATAPVWEPLTPEAGERGHRAIEALAKPTGPVFENLHAGEVASYVFQSVAKTIPTTADSAQAAVIGDALFVRAVVPVRALTGTGALGPLASLLNDRETLSFGGTFRVIRPGLSEFQVREIKLRDFKVPAGAVPRLLRQIDHGTRPEGVSADAIAVPTPASLGDVRIANGRVTLYKTTGAP